MAASTSSSKRETLMIMIVVIGFMATGGAVISLTSTAERNEVCQLKFITFRCIANGSRIVWTLNSMSQYSFDNLESKEKIIHKPQEDSYATLLPHGDGLWESTYSLLSLPSSDSMTVACFDGSDSEELTISVIAGLCESTSTPTTPGDAVISLTSTAQQNVLRPGEFVTFLCIANGSRLVWTLNSMSEFSFDNLERIERIIHKPLSESYAILLPGLWESTYTLFSVHSSGNMTVACFDGTDSEELIISVMADVPSVVPTIVTSSEVPTNVTSSFISSDSTVISVDTSATATSTTSGNGGLKTWHIILIVASVVSVLTGAVIAGVIIILLWKPECSVTVELAMKSKGEEVDIDKISHSEPEEQD